MSLLERSLYGPTMPTGSSRLLRPAALLAGTLVVLSLPYVLDAYYVGIATQVLIFGVWAMSLNVLAGSAGLFSLGHAGLLGVSAYSVVVAQTRFELPFLQAGLFAVVVTLVVSSLFSLMAMRATAVYFLMITLAQGMLVYGLAQSWVSVTDGDNGLRGGGPTGPLEEYYNYFWFVAVVAVVCLVVLRLFLVSTYGLRLRGVRDSPTRMAALGYDVMQQRIIAFNVAGLFAAISGVLYVGLFNFVSPRTVVVAASVEGLLMVILGGIGVFLGPMLGALLVIGIRTTLSTYTDRWPTVMGALLVISVLFARQGISPYLVSLTRRLLPGSRGPAGAAPPEPVVAADPVMDDASGVPRPAHL